MSEPEMTSPPRNTMHTSEDNSGDGYGYEDDDFDAEAEESVLETEECIEYNAPIGPNFVVTKHNGSLVDTRVRDQVSNGSVRNTVPSKQKSRGMGNRWATVNTSLSGGIRRLQIGTKGRYNPRSQNSSLGMSLQIQTRSGTLQRKISTTSLSGYPNFVKESTSAVQMRLNSAKKLQIKDLMSKVRTLEATIEDIRLENRTLKTVHHRQDLALKKYEGTDADLPKMLQHHRNEVHYLQVTLRKLNTRTRHYEEELRVMNHKLYKLEDENKKLLALVEEGNLDEKHDTNKQLKAVTLRANRLQDKLQEMGHHIEILEKNHNHQLSAENGKLRNINKKLFDCNQEIGRLVDLIKQKDRVINYLRIRACRIPDKEPTILKKMMHAQNEDVHRQSYMKRNNSNAGTRSYQDSQRINYRQNQNEKLTPRPGFVKESSGETSEDSARYSLVSGQSTRYRVSGSEMCDRMSNPDTKCAYISEDDYGTEEDTVQQESELDYNDNGDTFEPLQSADMLDYNPNKSLFLEALDSSCNVSSLNSPENSGRNVKIRGNGSQVEPDIPLDKIEIQSTKPRSEPQDNELKPSTGNTVGAGDASETLKEKREQIPVQWGKSSTKSEMVSSKIKSSPDIPNEVKPSDKIKLAPATKSEPSFIPTSEPGFVSQRSERGPEIPSNEYLLAKLRAKCASNKATDKLFSDSSDSNDDNDEAEDTEGEEEELDKNLPIKNMKLAFKEQPKIDWNLTDCNSFKSVHNFTDIIKGEQFSGRDDIQRARSKPSPETGMPLGSPRPSLPNTSSLPTEKCTPPIPENPVTPAFLSHIEKLSEIEITTKKATPHLPMPGVSTAKKTGFAALESSLFSLNSPPRPCPRASTTKNYFDNMPAPPPGSKQHFDFEFASIFNKNSTEMNNNTHPVTEQKSAEKLSKKEVSKQEYHDNLTSNFKQKSLSQSQINAQKNPHAGGTTSPSLTNLAKKSNIWK